MKLRVIKANKDNWYKVGEIYEVKDLHKYEPYGVQVVKEGNGHVPDVVMTDDYELIFE